LRAITEARTNLVNVDELSDEQLAALEQEFRRLGKKPDARAEATARAK
jgi:hypothetical protein